MMKMETLLKADSILIFQTNIETYRDVCRVGLMLNDHPQIESWSVDIDDVDRVLRIEGNEEFNEVEAIKMIGDSGYIAVEMTW